MGPGEVYSMFKLNGEDAAAAFTLRPEQRANGVPPHWMIYVAVDDADQIAARAASLGATIVAPPFDVFDFGRMAVIQDPTGAMFSIWQAKQHAGVGVWGRTGRGVRGRSQHPRSTRAADFYTQLFGWRMVTGKDMVDAVPGDYFHIMNGADMIGGVGPASQRDPHTPPHWLVYFEAASCGEATRRQRGSAPPPTSRTCKSAKAGLFPWSPTRRAQPSGFTRRKRKRPSGWHRPCCIPAGWPTSTCRACTSACNEGSRGSQPATLAPNQTARVARDRCAPRQRAHRRHRLVAQRRQILVDAARAPGACEWRCA
jgi:predicted enzyme related to lactoylglutathione lyase